MEKVKERIIEHLAVLKLKNDMKSPIICLYGPSGRGQDLPGQIDCRSAETQISFGCRSAVCIDEAEIRGHRRTYIGAMPGRIIQNLQKAGTSNPVFISRRD